MLEGASLNLAVSQPFNFFPLRRATAEKLRSVVYEFKNQFLDPIISCVQVIQETTVVTVGNFLHSNTDVSCGSHRLSEGLDLAPTPFVVAISVYEQERPRILTDVR